jgi:hypothetical protein
MKTFYLGMPINNGEVGSRDGIGIERARRVRDAIERVTGDTCTSRWIDHPFQNRDEFLLTVAVTDICDVAAADYVVVLPLTVTCRGTHVEMGLALAWGKPTYLYIPRGRDPMAFDKLCLKPPMLMQEAIERALAQEAGK